jgi:hypothetical protein
MIPFKEKGQDTILELLDNQKHKQGTLYWKMLSTFSKKLSWSSLPKLNCMFHLC